MPTLTALPGIALDRTLQLVRLPLSIAESTIGPDDPSTWPPHVVFEQIELTARETVGKLLHDQRLLDRAALQRTKLAQLRRATELEVEAAETSRQANIKLEDRRQQAQQHREEAEESADQREQELEQMRESAKAAVDREAAQEKAAARKKADARRKAAKAREDAAKRRQLEEQAKALDEEEQALAVKGRAMALEDRVEEKKTARKGS